MKNVLIVGAGQIGSSLASIYNDYKDIYNTTVIDVLYDTSIIPKDIDVMNVCYGYSPTNNYVESVVKYINEFNPNMVIIYGTVNVGNTREIYDATGVPIAHSPVMGIHPNLKQGMLTFKKIVGGIDNPTTKLVCQHLTSLGMDCMVYDSPENSEAAKLLDTTYYGWNIIYEKNVHKFCEENNLNFDQVYRNTNENYNSGYEKLGMPHVRRPVLKHMNGTIGGHCVIPNCKILKYKFLPANVILIEDENNANL